MTEQDRPRLQGIVHKVGSAPARPTCGNPCSHVHRGSSCCVSSLPACSRISVESTDAVFGEWGSMGGPSNLAGLCRCSIAVRSQADRIVRAVLFCCGIVARVCSCLFYVFGRSSAFAQHAQHPDMLRACCVSCAMSLRRRTCVAPTICNRCHAGVALNLRGRRPPGMPSGVRLGPGKSVEGRQATCCESGVVTHIDAAGGGTTSREF